MRTIYKAIGLLAACVPLQLASPAFGHFPWPTETQNRNAVDDLGEISANRADPQPAATVQARLTRLADVRQTTVSKFQLHGSEGRLGRISYQDVPQDIALVSQVIAEVYHEPRHEHFSLASRGKRFGSQEPQPAGSTTLKHLAEWADLNHPAYGGVIVGKILGGDASVQPFSKEIHVEDPARTDVLGNTAWEARRVEDGLHGVMLGRGPNNHAGSLEDNTSPSASHFLTASFINAQDPESQQPAPENLAEEDSQLADLPFAITSFGAARIGKGVYVYGGHTGEAHSYSNQEQSQKLLKLDLDSPSAGWQEVSEGQRLQGLAMVAHKRQLISIGGFSAYNDPDEDQDLHSLADVRAFDVKSLEWTDLPPLSLGRSSHDAVILGDTIYVVGGWNIDGQNETQWHTTAWSMNLSADAPEWTELPSPPFTRRALAMAAHQDKIYVIGGMNQQGPTRDVSVFDPATQTWSAGPELLGESPMSGFGASAWSTAGKLIVTTYTGDIQRLSSDGKSWKVIGKTQDARFFHRMLPLGRKTLISIGGANMEQGKYLAPERIELP